jgi:hypothetical protein
MAYIDVFNGDADGICALVQWRLANPQDARCVTGVKRDIELLDRVTAHSGDVVTVLDVSLDKNRTPLLRLLDQGAAVTYVDHHYAGDIPDHPGLTAVINEASEVCTSLLVNGRLQNRYRAWAITGAYGDNLRSSAQRLAREADDLDAAALERLEALGIYLNYNGYGETLDDLLFHPEALYQQAREYPSPLDFMTARRDTFAHLEDGYRSDMAQAEAAQTLPGSTEHALALVLPDAAWARRVSGVYSNELVNRHPDRAHAVLTEKPDGSYLVSVRAPRNRRAGADVLCRQFDTGGGRAAAAGINRLVDADLGRFIATFTAQYAA